MTQNKQTNPEHPMEHPIPAWKKLLLSALAVTLLLIAYSNHFNNAFHFDDHHVIVNNPYIRSLKNIPQFFTNASTFTVRPENATYRPLLSVTYALDYWRGNGLHSSAFHQSQIVFLILLGSLLTVLYTKILDFTGHRAANFHIALWTATFFCIHTANTETVNYLSSRSSLLSTLGVVAGLLLYIQYPNQRRFGTYLLPVILGALTKPLSIMFAPILLLYILLFEQKTSLTSIFSPSSTPALLRALGNALPSFLVLSGLYLFIDQMNSENLLLATVSRKDYALTQPYVWLHYFRLFFWPTGLTADTDWKFLSHWIDFRFFLGAGFITLLIGITLWCSRFPQLRPVAFGLGWFVLALLPTSSIIPLSEAYNEHRIFFPYVGLSIASTWGLSTLLSHFTKNKKRLQQAILITVGLIVLLLHATGTYQRNQVWRSEETLWEDVTRKSPENGRALMNYGLTQMSKGELKTALEYFEQARKYTPHYAHLEINLGIVKSELGRPSDAESHFKRALQLQPQFAAGHYYYARWLYEQLRGPESIAHLETCLRITPSDIHARNFLAQLYWTQGNPSSAIQLLEGALQIDPSNEFAKTLLQRISSSPTLSGEDLRKRGRAEIDRHNLMLAAELYSKSIEIDPSSAEAWNNLGWIRMHLQLFHESIPCFQKALEIDPQMQLAKNNLQWATAQIQ